MNVKYFLDTNILVYTFDDSSPEKRDRAREIVRDALGGGTGAISSQVVQEFINVATRKFTVPMTASEAALYLERVLLPLCQVWTDERGYRDALKIMETTGYAWFDSLILGAAIQAGAKELLSEDLRHGQVVEGVRIRNPFRS